MLDPIVRAAAHPSRAILDAPARRYRLSETGNVTANGSSSIRRAKCDIAEVKHAIQLAVRDMTIRMGAIAVALLAALATSNSSPDRPAKTVARTRGERCYMSLSVRTAQSVKTALHRRQTAYGKTRTKARHVLTIASACPTCTPVSQPVPAVRPTVALRFFATSPLASAKG
jgi:hypothetical protein